MNEVDLIKNWSNMDRAHHGHGENEILVAKIIFIARIQFNLRVMHTSNTNNMNSLYSGSHRMAETIWNDLIKKKKNK